MTTRREIDESDYRESTKQVNCQRYNDGRRASLLLASELLALAVCSAGYKTSSFVNNNNNNNINT